MATHSSVLAWRIPGTADPGGLPSMGSHRVEHDWSDLAAAAEYQFSSVAQSCPTLCDLHGPHCRVYGHDFEQTLEIVKDREAWRAAVHVVAKRWTRLSDWPTTRVYGIMGLLDEEHQFCPVTKYVRAQSRRVLSSKWEAWHLLAAAICKGAEIPMEDHPGGGGDEHLTRKTILDTLTITFSLFHFFAHSFWLYPILPLFLFSHSVVSDSWRPHRLQHTRLPCPSPSPGVCWNSRPSSWWCQPTILSSVTPFSCYLHSFLALGSFPMSRSFAPGGQSIGASALASVLPMNIQNWFPLGLMVWSLCSPRDSLSPFLLDGLLTTITLWSYFKQYVVVA